MSRRLLQNTREAHSIPQLTVEIRRFYWYRSFLRYAAKHYPPASVPGGVSGGCNGLMLADASRSGFGKRSLKPMAVYGKVVRLAGRLFLFRLGTSSCVGRIG